MRNKCNLMYVTPPLKSPSLGVVFRTPFIGRSRNGGVAEQTKPQCDEEERVGSLSIQIESFQLIHGWFCLPTSASLEDPFLSEGKMTSVPRRSHPVVSDWILGRGFPY